MIKNNNMLSIAFEEYEMAYGFSLKIMLFHITSEEDENINIYIHIALSEKVFERSTNEGLSEGEEEEAVINIIKEIIIRNIENNNILLNKNLHYYFYIGDAEKTIKRIQYLKNGPYIDHIILGHNLYEVGKSLIPATRNVLEHVAERIMWHSFYQFKATGSPVVDPNYNIYTSLYKVNQGSLTAIMKRLHKNGFFKSIQEVLGPISPIGAILDSNTTLSIEESYYSNVEVDLVKEYYTPSSGSLLTFLLDQSNHLNINELHADSSNVNISSGNSNNLLNENSKFEIIIKDMVRDYPLDMQVAYEKQIKEAFPEDIVKGLDMSSLKKLISNFLASKST